MTATQVNGIEVITAESVLSPLSTPDKPIRFKNILRLLLADDTTIYGCGKEGCDYTDEKPGRVRLHFRTHAGQKPQVRSAPKFERKTKEKGKPAVELPEPGDDESPLDFLAALQRVFDAPDVSPEETEALKARIAELEKELAQVKEELSKAAGERDKTASERDWWKSEHAVAVGTVKGIAEIIKRSKIQ